MHFLTVSPRLDSKSDFYHTRKIYCNNVLIPFCTVHKGLRGQEGFYMLNVLVKQQGPYNKHSSIAQSKYRSQVSSVSSWNLGGFWNRQVPCRERCSLGLLPTPYCNSTTLSLMLYHLSKLQKTNKQ